MNYYNDNKIQYVLSFPELDYIDLNILFKEELNRKIKISSDIAIISTITTYNSFFLNQCKNNNIEIIQTKQSNIYEAIKRIEKKYVLIIKDKDALIVNDIENDFLKEFNSLNMPFLFAGMEFPLPSNDLEGYRNTFIKGKYKNVNGMLMFGKTSDILKFYESIIDNERIEDSFIEEQIKIRKSLINYRKDFISYIDSQANLFSTITKINTIIKEKDNNRYIVNHNFLGIYDYIF